MQIRLQELLMGFIVIGLASLVSLSKIIPTSTPSQFLTGILIGMLIVASVTYVALTARLQH